MLHFSKSRNGLKHGEDTWQHKKKWEKIFSPVFRKYFICECCLQVVVTAVIFPLSHRSLLQVASTQTPANEPTLLCERNIVNAGAWHPLTRPTLYEVYSIGQAASEQSLQVSKVLVFTFHGLLMVHGHIKQSTMLVLVVQKFRKGRKEMDSWHSFCQFLFLCS